MRKILVGLLLLSLILSACAGGGKAAPPEDMPSTLLVSDETSQKTYSVADLQSLAAAQATFNDITYQGVILTTLLQDAGLDPLSLKAVKATAADGYSVNYDPVLFLRNDVLVAISTVGGPLAADDGFFRMVLPGEEGKLNLRMLSELRGIR